MIEVGYVELNREPENFFAKVEQAAFSPASIVPGIAFSLRNLAWQKRGR